MERTWINYLLISLYLCSLAVLGSMTAFRVYAEDYAAAVGFGILFFLNIPILLDQFFPPVRFLDVFGDDSDSDGW